MKSIEDFIKEYYKNDISRSEIEDIICDVKKMTRDIEPEGNGMIITYSFSCGAKYKPFFHHIISILKKEDHKILENFHKIPSDSIH